MKKTTTSEDQETYISEESETSNLRKDMALVKLVIGEAQKLIAAGKNAKFACENKLQEHAIEDRLNGIETEGYKSRIYKGSEYDLACQVIAEARKIVYSRRKRMTWKKKN